MKVEIECLNVLLKWEVNGSAVLLCIINGQYVTDSLDVHTFEYGTYLM